jgi:hypothetical protein
LDEDIDELNQLEQHITDCKECQTVIVQLNDMQSTLSEALKNHWKPPSLDNNELNSLIHSVISDVEKPKEVKNIRTLFRHSAWIIGFSIMFFYSFILNDTRWKKFPCNQTRFIITLSLKYGLAESLMEKTMYVCLIRWRFSSDGWVVYSSIKADPATGLLLVPTIELVDRVSNTIKVIHESNGNLNALWSIWDLAPSISGDGRWTVYIIWK